MLSMAGQQRNKLNHLQRILPEGLLADAAWMEKNGYSRALRSQYVAAGWLEQPARGVYRRPSGKLRWEHVVISLQTLLAVPVIVGGRTALELQGFAHYLPVDDTQEVHLYGDRPPPGWTGKLDLDARLVFHNAKRLFQEGVFLHGLDGTSAGFQDQAAVTNNRIHGSLLHQAWGHWGWLMTLSTPERATLELLDEIPHRETFHQADVLMEGLRTLSPHRLQQLLEACHSVKVKRLFLWFAERHQLPCLRQIKQERLNLGRGKRMLVRGGRLDPTYLITVPEDLDAVS